MFSCYPEDYLKFSTPYIHFTLDLITSILVIPELKKSLILTLKKNS